MDFCPYYKQTPGAEGVKGGFLLWVSFAQPGTWHSAVGLCPTGRGRAGSHSVASCSEFPKQQLYNQFWPRDDLLAFVLVLCRVSSFWLCVRSEAVAFSPCRLFPERL